MDIDGLNSLKYILLHSEARPLYTYYKARFNKTMIRKEFIDTIPENQPYEIF